MAYMSQDRKAAIAAALKKAIPAAWKYSLSVRHHSTLVLTIRSAPVDLVDVFTSTYDPEARASHKQRAYADVNVYHWQRQMEGADAALIAAFGEIMAALNTGNHDRSDIQSDYFDVGWYVDVKIGKWDKPFVATVAKEAA